MKSIKKIKTVFVRVKTFTMGADLLNMQYNTFAIL